jgi:hypothetical protein
MNDNSTITVKTENALEYLFDLLEECGEFEIQASLPESASQKDALRGVTKKNVTDTEYNQETDRFIAYGSFALADPRLIHRATRWEPACYDDTEREYYFSVSVKLNDMYDCPVAHIENI